MAKAKARLKSIDDLPDALKELYAPEADGTFVLQVEAVDGFALENVKGLRSALEKERSAAAELKATLSKLGDRSIDDVLKSHEQVLEWQKSGSPDDKARKEIESIKSQMATAHGKELASLKQELATAEAQLLGEIGTSKLQQAIVARKGNVKLLMPVASPHLRVRKVDGKYVTEVIGGDGVVRISPKNPQAPMSPEEFVDELASDRDYAMCFEASGNSGGGATGGGQSGGTAARSGAAKTVSRSDAEAMQANFDGIADGSVKVVD